MSERDPNTQLLNNNGQQKGKNDLNNSYYAEDDERIPVFQ